MKKLLPDRKKERPQIVVTNLIDVILLLVFFFMITSSFAKDKQKLPIQLPQASTGVAIEENVVTITMNKEARVFWGNEEVTLPTLDGKLRSILEKSPDVSIIVEADESVDYGKIMGILDIVKGAGGTNIGLSAKKRNAGVSPQ